MVSLMIDHFMSTMTLFFICFLATTKESVFTKKKVKVGIISPYKAPVYPIGEKVKNYSADPNDDFSISVRFVDGF